MAQVPIGEHGGQEGGVKQENHTMTTVLLSDGPNKGSCDTTAKTDTNGAKDQCPSVTEPGATDTALHNEAIISGEAAATKPKRKSKRSAAQRGPTALSKNRGTGFEEYFCDPPITPAEYQEERDVIYASHRPFVDRIEECIQRFRARRRFDSDRENLFSKYLMLGGIDATQRQFQGSRNMPNEDIAAATKSELREMTADSILDRKGTDARWFHPNEQSGWEVDFTGVVSGFLSERLGAMVGSDAHLMEMGIDVVRKFLLYLLQHDVCPEYEKDVKDALKVCDQAGIELPAIGSLLQVVPGAFNTAARLLFCNDHKDDSGFSFNDFTRLELPEFDILDAERIWCSTLATIEDQDGKTPFFDMVMEKRHKGEPIEVVDTIEQVFQVESVSRRSHLADFFAGIKNDAGEPGTFTHTGIAVMVPSATESGWANVQKRAPGVADHEIFFFEDHLFEEDAPDGPWPLIVPGMKMRLQVCTLNINFKFIKAVLEVYPTFHTFLPQELMLSYKAPAPNPRPAPSVQDPDAEETQAGRDMARERD